MAALCRIFVELERLSMADYCRLRLSSPSDPLLPVAKVNFPAAERSGVHRLLELHNLDRAAEFEVQ